MDAYPLATPAGATKIMSKEYFGFFGLVMFLLSIVAMFMDQSPVVPLTLLMLSQLYLVTAVLLIAIEKRGKS